MYFCISATKSAKGFELGGASMTPRYRMATYFLDVEYPSGACFLLFLEDFAFSQVSFAAGFASSVSDKTIVSSASFGVEKLTFVFFVVLFFFVFLLTFRCLSLVFWLGFPEGEVV
jgi:hypothetical protein